MACTRKVPQEKIPRRGEVIKWSRKVPKTDILEEFGHPTGSCLAETASLKAVGV